MTVHGALGKRPRMIQEFAWMDSDEESQKANFGFWFGGLGFRVEGLGFRV